MTKINWSKKMACFFLISFLIISLGCEMPWNEATNPTTTTDGVNNWAKYAGTYKGTIRYNLFNEPEIILPINFVIDTNGNLTSMTIDGQSINPSDKNEGIVTSGSEFITQDGKIIGQASAYDPNFGSYTFSYSGFINDSGNFSLNSTYKGGIWGTMAIVANRV